MKKHPDDLEILRRDLKFPLNQIEIAIRANFKCEYCDKDLLESVDSYDSWQIDHIVPDGNDDLENLALACKTCNFMKRHSGKNILENLKTRSEKVAFSRKLVTERRKKKEETLKKVRVFAQELIKNKDII